MNRVRLSALVVLVLLTGAACAPDPAESTVDTVDTVDLAGRAVTFPAEDGVGLTGRVFGAGTTAIVLANMGDNDPGPWEAFAPDLAGRGFLVLSFSFRYPRRTATFTTAMAASAVPDLWGATAYARGAGATRVVLIGASLGGMAVGKVAGRAGATAAVVLSAGPDLPEYGLVVTPAELGAMAGPTLFIASDDDPTVTPDQTRAYYERAAEPKQFRTLPGDGHGVHILATARAGALRNILIDFVNAARG